MLFSDVGYLCHGLRIKIDCSNVSVTLSHSMCSYIVTDRGDKHCGAGRGVGGGVTPVWPAALGAMGVKMEFPELPPGPEID